MKVELKRVPKKQVAYIFHEGSIEDLSDLMGEVIEWVVKNALEITGPPYGVYYSSPEDVSLDNMKYEVGIPFEGRAEVEGKVKVKEIPDQTVLSATHMGPYHEVGPVYAALMDHVVSESYEMVGAPMEIYMNNLGEVSENELITEIQFPVVKK